MKDFVKKIKQEDARIAFKKQKLAKARAAAMVSNPPATTPVIIISTQAETSAVRPETSGPPAVPRSTPVTISPLHPSLPPKPVIPSKTVTPQDNSKLTAPPMAPLITNSTPARVSTPVPPPVALADPEIAKYEEVILLLSTVNPGLNSFITEQTTMGLAGTSSCS